jgi:hypothetical protein
MHFAFGYTTVNMLLCLMAHKIAFNNKKILVVFDVLTIYRVEITLANREIMNRVKHVCFAGAIRSHKTVQLGREAELRLIPALEINQLQIFQIHHGMTKLREVLRLREYLPSEKITNFAPPKKKADH